MIPIAIHDQSRHTIALAPDQPAEAQIHAASFPVLDGLRDPALEKIQIEVLPSARKAPGHDLRFAIVNRAADQMVPAILQRDDVAIDRISESLQHFAGEHPIMAVQNARTRFDNEAGHWGEWIVIGEL